MTRKIDETWKRGVFDQLVGLVISYLKGEIGSDPISAFQYDMKNRAKSTLLTSACSHLSL